MFAVIKTGGKQYKVAPEDVITVEKLQAEAGDTVEITDVLMVGGDGTPSIGAPHVEGATVAAEVVEQTRGDKIMVFKKKRRTTYRRTAGHRQDHTVLRITEILTGGKKASKKKAAPKAAEAEAKPAPAEEEAPKAEPAPEVAAGADDLKKISGVGPALEKKLHALGVTSFQQIAEFTPEKIAEVDEQLNFKGRIEREDWISQAKTLMAGDGDA